MQCQGSLNLLAQCLQVFYGMLILYKQSCTCLQ